MFCLEYKELYIVPTEMTKNRTCQSYRWKQFAVSDDLKALEEIRNSQKDPNNWRIIKMGCSSVEI